MKIISYNVNGIRAAIQKGFIDWLKEENPDVLCLQELKADIEQVDISAIEALGYQIYWHSAQKKGYSGVAIFSKVTPKSVTIGCGIEKYDAEGRVIRADFEDFSVMSVYMPSGSSGDERQGFKMIWLADFYQYIDQLKKEIPHLIISGDYNICHKAIDIHNPKSNANSSGFLPEEREWMENFINSGFVDSFRHINAEPHHYSWWSYRAGARGKNLGWRIDYHLVSDSLRERISHAQILPEVKHSDHCPVVLHLN
ncbi:exodeoxyribonuclease III [Aquirufa ecclesiirivi]|uniref:exodeoxyribonuclease III n=1 Tax=Aquirufa ecclesiirivi TaxID=2715124 RepID=UPI0022A83760|nr:exodeoxyribonuclease III [Aquirufa ecclesiirivi]MCZ2473490.1 exodeoxyribonuclease III [Aquirufa ecclesiirivi]